MRNIDDKDIPVSDILVFLILLALLFYVVGANSEIRDLQRRVGQLEQRIEEVR